MDSIQVFRATSLLDQLAARPQKEQEAGPASAFHDLLRETSEHGKEAARSAEQFLTTGEGELHEVQMKLAKADLSFRFLLEVRNRLTEAYQELTRLPV